jgi:hypothetical protein
MRSLGCPHAAMTIALLYRHMLSSFAHNASIGFPWETGNYFSSWPKLNIDTGGEFKNERDDPLRRGFRRPDSFYRCSGLLLEI